MWRLLLPRLLVAMLLLRLLQRVLRLLSSPPALPLVSGRLVVLSVSASSRDVAKETTACSTLRQAGFAAVSIVGQDAAAQEAALTGVCAAIVAREEATLSSREGFEHSVLAGQDVADLVLCVGDGPLGAGVPPLHLAASEIIRIPDLSTAAIAEALLVYSRTEQRHGR